MLYNGYRARTSITLHWSPSVSCCSTDTLASRGSRCSVYINAAADSPVRTALLTPRTTRPSDLAAGSRVRAGLQTLRLILPSAPVYHATAGSPMSDFQLHIAIINFMAGYFRPGTSGDIHLKYILLIHIIFYQRAVYLCLGLQYG